jgi:hypothetical protein
MTTDPMPEPDGPEDERFVYVVTAAGVEAVREAAVMVDSEREAPAADRLPRDVRPDQSQRRNEEDHRRRSALPVHHRRAPSGG